MKKYIWLIFISLLSFSFILTSCDDPTKEEPGKTDPEKPDGPLMLDVVRMVYLGDYYENGGHNFYFCFTHGDVEVSSSMKIFGTGYFLSLDMNAKSHIDLYPDTTSYTFSDSDYPEPGTFSAGYPYSMGDDFGSEDSFIYNMGSYVLKLENDVPLDTLYIVDGVVDVHGSIENAVIDFSFVYHDGTTQKFCWKGIPDVFDNGGAEPPGPEGVNFDYEPETPVTMACVIDSLQLDHYGDYFMYGDNIYFLQFMSTASDGSLVGGAFQLYADKQGVTPVGIYEINSTMEPWSCMASPGGDSNGDYPSYLYTDISEMGYANAYYLVSGEMTITENSIVIDAVSVKGSKFSITYEGDYVVNEKETEPESAPVARGFSTADKAVFVRNGRLPFFY